jgi:2-(1,2-epoxy-1,2-dihydrophenyl)acetyl-CoA isomerase
LVPDSGGTFFLPRLIGFQKASAFMMLGDKVSAEAAENLGMVYKVYFEADFNAEVTVFAETLAQMPTKALGMTKRASSTSSASDP